MAMTMTQKILAAHAGLNAVVAGQLVEANLDLASANLKKRERNACATAIKSVL